MTYAGFLRIAGIIAALYTLLMLAGCATVDQKIGLGYAPVDRPFGRHSGDIAVARQDPAQPQRNNKGEWIIGSLNNVHGVHQADILSDRSIGEWITDALLLELKHAGYTVTYTAALPQGAPHGIVINDINAFLNVNKGTVSDDSKHELKFNVDAYVNGTRVKTFTVSSRDKSTLLTTSQEALEKIMLQSIRDAMVQIVPEIIGLIDKK